MEPTRDLSLRRAVLMMGLLGGTALPALAEKASAVPVHVPLSGCTMAFDRDGSRVSGC
jgi:hypothetical protein